MSQNNPTEPDQGYGELTHVGAMNEYGVRYPDGREDFPNFNIYGVPTDSLSTLEGQGKAQDNYLLSLAGNGVPITPELRLSFIKRTRVTSITETVYLNTEA